MKSSSKLLIHSYPQNFNPKAELVAKVRQSLNCCFHMPRAGPRGFQAFQHDYQFAQPLLQEDLLVAKPVTWGCLELKPVDFQQLQRSKLDFHSEPQSGSVFPPGGYQWFLAYQKLSYSAAPSVLKLRSSLKLPLSPLLNQKALETLLAEQVRVWSQLKAE